MPKKPPAGGILTGYWEVFSIPGRVTLMSVEERGSWMMTFEESIKKLATHIGQTKALKLWQQYQLSDGVGRRELESLIELQLHQKYGENPLRDENGLQVPP